MYGVLVVASAARTVLSMVLAWRVRAAVIESGGGVMRGDPVSLAQLRIADELKTTKTTAVISRSGRCRVD